MAGEPLPACFRYRVVKRFDAGNAEVTTDLPHLGQSTWTVAATPWRGGSSRRANCGR